jgi:radical SAM protein with 4Fe4S-binding SPASM domain
MADVHALIQATPDISDKSCEKGMPRCMAPWQSLMVEGNGVVQPCAYRGNYGNPAIHPPVGNVMEKSLEEIWNGEEMQKLRCWMAEGDLESAGCAKCLAVAQNQPLQMAYDTRIDDKDAPNSEYRDNIILKRKEVREGKTIIESKPLVLYVTPTHRCNLRCTHCYETPTRTATIRRGGFQEEVEDWLPYLTELVPGGGEPLLLTFWKKVFENPSANRNPYLHLSFTTGGHFVTETMFESLTKCADGQVMISFDAPNKTTFESIRVNANFDQVVSNMLRFRDITLEKRDGATVMHISIMKQNIRLLPELIRLAAAMEIPFNFQPVVAYPVDHSLRVFQNGPNGTEMWKSSMDEASHLVKTLLIPTLKASAKRRGRKLSESVEQAQLDHIPALSNLIPWSVLGRKHRLFVGQLPAYQMDYMAFLKRYGLKHHQRGQNMLIAFFPKDEAGNKGEAHHFARLTSDGKFRVFIPPGKYYAAMNRRENYALAFNGLDVTIPEIDSVSHILESPSIPQIGYPIGGFGTSQ